MKRDGVRPSGVDGRFNRYDNNRRLLNTSSCNAVC